MSVLRGSVLGTLPYTFSVVLWVSDDAESNYETLEVARSGYNRLPITIDIGYQSQGHYHGSDEPSHIVTLSTVFFGTPRRLAQSFLGSDRPVMR